MFSAPWYISLVYTTTATCGPRSIKRPMTTIAKLFMTGRSQAVRLPRELRFEGNEVVAKRFGSGVLLIPMDAPWEIMKQALDEFEPDFRITRDQPGVQERPGWAQ